MAAESTNVPTTKQSFAASISGLVAGAAATDILAILGVSNRQVTINRIIVSGIATAAASVPMSVIKRSAPDTGGTSTVLVGVTMDSRDPASAQAVVSAYTANPALGATVGPIASARVILSSTSASVGINPTVFDFERMYKKLPMLVAAGESLCLNYGGTTAAGNLLDISIEWTEERI